MVIQLRRKTRLAVALVAATLAGGASARAEVKMPAIFSDHMVLQQQIPVPVWGWAQPGEDVTVTFNGQKLSAKANENGRWGVKLTPLAASATPAELEIAGKNTVKFTDVLVGEVWVCSGQSNMEFGIRNAVNGDKEVAEADHPLIRLFTVPKKVTGVPQDDVRRDPPFGGEWLACTPTNVGGGGWGGFTAAGYFFGRDLQNELKVPVGLIHTSWGGTPAEAWTAHKYIVDDPDLRPIEERYDQSAERFSREKESVAKMRDEAMRKWEAQAALAKAAGKAPPRKPSTPSDPSESPNSPSVLYNGMIAPIVPFAIRGAIWYQGESNAGRAHQYRKLLPAMIKSWRDAWDEPDMDFYIVSLANFQNPAREPGNSDWAELREAQAMTAAQPHNGQALAIDLADAGNPGDIHPKNKQDVGHRLALVALAKTYGKSVDYSGPEYKDFKIDGDKAVIHFNFADGMMARGGPPLKGFQIAGEDQKWYWADAKIEGNSVIVSSPSVAKPAAVRYDWAHNPQGNLYGKDGLPAVPFRTDTWNGVTDNAK